MRKYALLFAAVLALAACDDDPVGPTDTTDTTGTESYALVLCEGAWGGNDASIARINTADGTADPEWFETANGRGLGDVAQDILLCGSQAYVTVTFSNTLEVINTANGRSVRHSMGRQHPRYMAMDGSRLFVTCYSDRMVAVYDTADLDNAITFMYLGDYQPEGIAVAGGRLFVASSWIQQQNQNYEYDSTVYIFDLNTNELVTTVEVGLNPQTVVALDDNRVAVNYNGDYGSHPAGCAIIDAGTLAVSQLGRAATGMAAAGGALYGYSRQGYGSTSTATFWRFADGSFADLPVNVNTPYSISVDTAGYLYVTTDGNYTAAGDVLCLSLDGTLLWRCEAGMLPKKVIPLR